MSPFQAAIEGTREIGLAVMATTLSLLAVFVPVGFMGGIVGRFMSSFGLTSAAAIAISLLVSFTLTPMLAARWIRATRRTTSATTCRGAGFYRHIDRLYTRLLEWSMAHRWVDRGAVRRGRRLDRAALQDARRELRARRGRVAVPGVGAPAGRVEPRGDAVAARPDRARHPREAARRVGHARDRRVRRRAAAQPYQGDGVRAADARSTTRPSQQALVDPGAQADRSRTGSSAVVSVQGSRAVIGRRRARRARSSTRSSGPISQKLDEYTAQRARDRRQGAGASSTPTAPTCPAGPSCGSTIDRKRAADLGVRVQDVSQTVNALMAGQEVTTFNAGQRPVRRRAEGAGLVPPHARDPRRRHRAHRQRRARAAAQPRDASTEATRPASIDRLNRQRQISVTANSAPGSLAGRRHRRRSRRPSTQLDMEPGYRLVTSGQSQELGRAVYYFGSRSRCRSCSCTWCSRRSSSRSSTR